MPPYVMVDVNVLLPICCHDGSGMPYLCSFVEDVFALLGVMTIKGVCKLACGKKKKISNDQVKFATKHIRVKAKQVFVNFR